MFKNNNTSYHNVNDELYRRTREFASAVNALGYGGNGFSMRWYLQPTVGCPNTRAVDEAFQKQNFRAVVKIIELLWHYGRDNIDPRRVVDLINLAIQHPLAQKSYNPLKKSTCQSKLVGMRDAIARDLGERVEAQQAQVNWMRH